MAIKISRYVQITSSVSGAQSVQQQKLVGRRFIDNPLLPLNTILSVKPGGADDYFGASSIEAAFARQYFSYVSPAPASQAEELQFYSYPATARPARVYAPTNTTSLADLKLITTGVMKIVILGDTYNITAINLSGASDLAAVATAVSAKITAAVGSSTNVAISYDAATQAFVATASAALDGSIEFEFVVGDDVGAALGFQSPDAINSPGSPAQTPLEGFQASENISDNFGSASFNPTIVFASGQHKDLAMYVAGENVKYQLYYSVSDLGNAQSLHTELEDIPSVGLILNKTAGEYKEALPMAVMAATNYNRRNAAINYMFRQAGGLTADVRTDNEANQFDAINVSYYGQTATAGQNISFFQRGFLLGTATSPRDMSVHANEQWLKGYLKSRLMALFLGTNRIPANLDGKGMVLAIVQEGVERAIFNGTILIGATLTELQKVTVNSLTGDPLAYQDIQSNGYWSDAEIIVDNSGGVEEYLCLYNLVYKKGDVVRKISASHNLV